MATVTSFAEFLTAIAGSEDIVLANDIDAQAEGYSAPLTININCDIDGQGHSISNLPVSQYMGLKGGITIKEVNFRNLLIKGSAGQIFYRTSNSSTVKVQGCKMGLSFSGNNGAFYMMRASTSGSGYLLQFLDSALDITLYNIGSMYNSDVGFTRTNCVFRRAFVSNQVSPTTFRAEDSAVVAYQCSLGGKYAVAGSNSYLAFLECEASTEPSVSAAATCLFCDGGVDCSVSGGKIVTAEQLRSESYLREIGFLP